MQDLDEAILEYLDLARNVLQRAKQLTEPQPGIRILWSPAQLLCGAVSLAEESESFRGLVLAAKREYAITHPMMRCSPVDSAATTSFFCRSGIYESLFSGAIVLPKVVINQFRSAFSASTHSVKYLALLEGVSFGTETIDCGSYRIQRFSSGELDDLLENNMRTVFYRSWRVDTLTLDACWFIVVEGIEPHPLCVDRTKDDLDWEMPVEPSAYPKVLDRAARHFAMFTWNLASEWDSTPISVAGFECGIPYYPAIRLFLAISDSPLVPPEESPDIRWLAGMRGNQAFQINLGNEKALDFSRWMLHIDRLLSVVSAHRQQWRFVEVASGFLLKGFLTRGPESILWNVTAIEALLGDRDAGLTRRLAMRLALALGKDQSRSKIEGLFKHIYRFRSVVIHGDACLLDSKVTACTMILARELACILLVWMLSWLTEIAGNWRQGVPLPTREQLLAAVDSLGGQEVHGPEWLGSMPSQFPHIPTWLDPERLRERWRTEYEKGQKHQLDPERAAALRQLLGLDEWLENLLRGDKR